MSPIFSNPWADLAGTLLTTFVLLALVTWVGIKILSSTFFDSFSPTIPASPTPTRYHVLPADDPCDHPFADLPLTELHSHLFDRHFEVWNSLAADGKREPPPHRYRYEHAADHGVTIGG